MTGRGVGNRGVSLPDLLDRSMRLGQRRVALQRMLMMEAAGLPMDDATRAFCHPTRMNLPLRELDRMYAAAQAWVDMLQGSGAPVAFDDAKARAR